MRVAVVGGGIAGLAAAWELATSGAQVSVYEPGHLGGKLLTSDFLGRPVDEGADAMLARVPDGIRLCQELGLGDELVAPAASKALLWSGGRLRPLPDGLVLGAPARLVPLARSGILSWPGMARALGDLVLPRTDVGDDVSVWDLVASRFGPEVAARLVDPLVGSIYAGTTKQLSAATAAPQLLAAARDRRSLLASLRQAARRPLAAGTEGPVFMAPRRGMQSVVDRLVERLTSPEMSARFFPVEVTALALNGGNVVVDPGDQPYDGVVLAAPAPAAVRLLSPLTGRTPSEIPELADARSASVGIVTLGFGTSSLAVPTGYSGLLVAPGSDLLMTACSFGSHKWPHWSSPGTVVLRVSVGKAGDERWASLPEEDLVRRLVEELGAVLGRASDGGRASEGGRAPNPLAGGWRVSRWPSALPQYPVGHLDHMATLRARLAQQAPTVALAGATFGRVGVPACIASGRQAGAAVLAAVRSLPEPAT
jgi:protoporphyrinogen/coproporphyrinogen III oxidase